MSLGKKKMLSQGAAAAPPPTATDHFKTVIYTGNGSSQNVDTVGFKPDFVWLKAQNATVNSMITDSVRGASYGLASQSSDQHYLESGKNLNSFRTLGFSVSGQANGGYRVNGSAGGAFSGNPPNYVAWCWKGGGAAANNTAGTITSSVSANQTAGFSIVQFTSNSGNITVGHGLSAVPELIILKTISFTDDWFVNCIGLTNQSNRALRLNATTGEETSNAFWNNTAPTSTTFSVGNGVSVSGQSYIAYCFHSVAGYQKVDKYTGNSGTNAITTGFQPRWVLMKNTANGYSWIIQDSVRGTSKILYANIGNSEVSTSTHITSFDSNGFTLGSNADVNNSGDTYIYLAIA